MEFSYKAVDSNGRLETGSLEAPTHSAVLVELGRRHLLPVLVQPHSTRLSVSLFGRWRTNSSISRGDLVAFTQGLAALLKAGLVLHRALHILGATSDRAAIRGLSIELERKVRAGSSFADALHAHGRHLPGFYVTMTRAAEVGGSLAEGLERLGAFIQRGAEVRERIVSSLLYPTILLGMILLTLVLLLTVVLPKFKALFAGSDVDLPWPTAAVLALGDAAKAFGLPVVICIVLLIIAFSIAWRGPRWGLPIDRYLLRARWTFALATNIQTSRYLRTIGALVRNGVPLPDATRIARGVMNNRALLAAADTVHEHLKQGEALSDLLDQAHLFPKNAVQLARVGEETGRMHELLTEAADTLDREAQSRLDRLLALLVPSVTIAMGALVAALIGSVLVGILSLNDLAF